MGKPFGSLPRVADGSVGAALRLAACGSLRASRSGIVSAIRYLLGSFNGMETL
jgi:hypothetical protein